VANPASTYFLHLLVPAFSLVAATTAFAQSPGGRPMAAGETYTTIVVSVRENTGAPLQNGAFVRLSSDFGGLRLTATTQDGGAATFPSIRSGEYLVEVSSVGYRTTTERASVLPGNSSYNVYVYMMPEGGPIGSAAPAGTTMTPRLQSEIDKGLDKMRHQQFDAARAHFEKAAKMAPANPDVQYLWGMLEYSQQHFDLARTKFEAAISVAPSHERSLVALGELELRTGHADQAAATLEKAYVLNGADWRTHFLLANAYAAQREYKRARPHAERAADLAKERGAPARLLLGRILLAQGKTGEAKGAFEAVVKNFPNESFARDAKAALIELEKPSALTPAALVKPNPVPAPEAVAVPPPPPPAVVRPWAPPDVDAKEYALAPDVTCSTDELLTRTRARTMKQLANFEEFMATEHIEHQDVDAYGNSGPMKTKDFTYLVFLKKGKNGSIFLEEDRDGGENLTEFPTSLASRGLVGLGVFLFDPDYENDVTYKCEGLGAWRGQAAWEIRFEQRREMASRLMTWKNNRGIFPVALKGRAWVAANSYDLLHIETDLREPIPRLELDRDHLLIDYGPVQFDRGKKSLWLPWYAELYLQVHGKRYHHRHTLRNYALFSVDTEHQINAPKETPREN
jgi:tetratricopeptide (TPR) repeat protein